MYQEFEVLSAKEKKFDHVTGRLASTRVIIALSLVRHRIHASTRVPPSTGRNQWK